ncbi:uncharacterized protein LOC127423802 [Myxocyprinus asiaticus]|uniref:uncharacterized protein LOC127423802 n=1 Tax=Myxocyprinus asiaticus TaxID=70543 RepID=UPI0022220588|nr:uncharacterized protein LOC127423802 [Myxocyprinus asiaticus]
MCFSMSKTQFVILLVLPALVSVAEGIKIEFPGIAPKISGCINVKCAMEINKCTNDHGTDLTVKLKGCIASRCKQAMSSCMEWIIQAVLSIQQASLAHIPEQFSSLKTLTYLMKTFGINSYLHCWQHSDLQKSSQITECLIEKAQPYVTSAIKPFFRKPDFVSCWLSQVLRRYFSCYDFIGEEYFSSVQQKFEQMTETHFPEFALCMMNLAKYWNDGCGEMYTHIYGLTPTEQTKYKDLITCVIDNMITATAACN